MSGQSEKKENNKTNSLPLNKLIFKKYRIINIISEGIFGHIYLVLNEKTHNYFAMKAENQDNNIDILEKEAFNLYSIKGLGIPELITFGKINNYKILIEQLLSKSLAELFSDYNYKFSIQDICLIALQLIDRIEWIHSKTLVHRDIKPEYFFIGVNDPNIIYLTEFGQCSKYCSSKTGKHIIQGFRGTFTGTLKYSSANAQRGNQQSRRDDIESLGYTILYFMKGKLPWENLNQNYNDKEIFLKTYAMKKYMPIERLCKGLPLEMKEYFKYARALKFKEEPNYEFLRNLFKNILKKEGIENFENINLSWVNPVNNRNSKIKRIKTLNHKYRIFLKIKNKIESNQGIETEYNLSNKTPIKGKVFYTNYPSFTSDKIPKKEKNISDLLKLKDINSDFGINKTNRLEQIKKQPEKEIKTEKYSTSKEKNIYLSHENNRNEDNHQNKKENNNTKNNNLNFDILNMNKNAEQKTIDLSKANNNLNKKLKIKKVKTNTHLNQNRDIITRNKKQFSKVIDNNNHSNIYYKLNSLNKNKLNLTNINDNKMNDFINYNRKFQTNNHIKYIETDSNIDNRQYMNYTNVNNNNKYLNTQIYGRNDWLMDDNFKINNINQNYNNNNFTISNNYNILIKNK